MSCAPSLYIRYDQLKEITYLASFIGPILGGLFLRKKYAFVGLIAILCFLGTACNQITMEHKMEKWKETVATIQEMENSENDDNLGYYDRKQLRNANAKRKNEAVQALSDTLDWKTAEDITDFMDEYLINNCVEDLVSDCEILDKAVWYGTIEEHLDSLKVNAITEHAEIVSPFSTTLKGSEGFYKDHPELLKTEEYTHDGKFYNRSGQNVHYEEKTDRRVYTAYGDYAVRIDDEYYYNQGKYGWDNGVFRDELPSWEHNTKVVLLYKDNYLVSGKSMTELMNELEKATIYFLPDSGAYYKVEFLSSNTPYINKLEIS